MRTFTVISDLHIGVVRSAGTTPVTAFALRRYALDCFEDLLIQAEDSDLLINGDLFDTDSIPYMDLLHTHKLLRDWLLRNLESKLILPPGNHDLSKTTATMSSQQFLTYLLQAEFGERVHSPREGEAITVAGEKGWVIPHMPNQELFDIEIEKVPKVKYLFLHCNYDNKFAMQSDHSLNLSPEQARKLPVERIVLGHEHQRSMHLAGKVQVIGNQFPTSVADCLGNKDKYMALITADKFELIPTWVGSESFFRVNWQDGGTVPDTAQFIRVEGDVSAAEATAAINAITKLRKSHSAFVVTNAVAIAGRDESQHAISLESATNFNVVEALMKRLAKHPKWVAKVKTLMEKNNVTG